MKRRGFLGFMGGAAVAGPGMLKDAAASVVQDMALGKAGILAPVADAYLPSAAPSGAAGAFGQITRATDMLTKLRALTSEDLSRKKRNIAVYGLDPDIASYRSISMSAKIDWQRERELTRIIENRKHQWGKMLLGVDPYNDDPLS